MVALPDLPGSLYPLIMLVALGTGGWLLRRSQSGLALPREQRVAIALAAFTGAMMGAKLPFLFGDLSRLVDGTAWFANGKTILCGMVGAYLAVEATKWVLEIRTKTGDSFVVPVAVAIAIGRLGCLSAGCCFGIPTDLPWGLQCAAVDDLWRHPTQLYESLFHFAAAGVFWSLRTHGVWPGQLAKAYILSYLAYRLISEQWRPEAELLWGLTAYQWFALALAPVFAGLWWWDTRAGEATVARA